MKRELGETYHKLALVNSANKGIRNFYLREAYGNYRELTRGPGARREDYLQAAAISMELHLYAQAEKILEEGKKKFDADVDFILLEAENEFYRKNVFRVMRLCKQAAKGKTPDRRKKKEMLPEQSAIIDFWGGE